MAEAEATRGDAGRPAAEEAEALAGLSPHEAADRLARLESEERALAFRLLDKDDAVEAFEALDPIHQRELVDALRADQVLGLVEAMDPDDRARLFDEMPAGVAVRLLEGLSAHERALTATLLGYPERSAGRIMSPEFVALHGGMSARDALATVRERGAAAETIYVLPVVDTGRCLAGVVHLRDLVLARPDTPVAGLLDPTAPAVAAHEDQEAVARLMQEEDLLAVPVVDGERRLVGVVTVDDAMEVLEAEETEDRARQSAAEPLGRPYLATSITGLVRSRVVWLVVLVAAGALTVSVLDAFEDTLDRVVALALFVPLLIGTGGNAGAQAASTVIRALAVGEVRFADLPRVVWREVRVGVLLGATFGGLGFVLVWALFDAEIAIVVSLTLLAICTLATFFGSLLPLLARRVNIDPAVVSTPMISTIVDATGLVIYFVIAEAVIGV